MADAARRRVHRADGPGGMATRASGDRRRHGADRGNRPPKRSAARRSRSARSSPARQRSCRHLAGQFVRMVACVRTTGTASSRSNYGRAWRNLGSSRSRTAWEPLPRRACAPIEEGLAAVLRRDRHDRTDVWFVRDDGSNLAENVGDLTEVVSSMGLPMIERFHDPCAVREMFEAGIVRYLARRAIRPRRRHARLPIAALVGSLRQTG